MDKLLTTDCYKLIRLVCMSLVQPRAQSNCQPKFLDVSDLIEENKSRIVAEPHNHKALTNLSAERSDSHVIHVRAVAFGIMSTTIDLAVSRGVKPIIWRQEEKKTLRNGHLVNVMFQGCLFLECVFSKVLAQNKLWFKTSCGSKHDR
jgi:hypothetical protein